MSNSLMLDVKNSDRSLSVEQNESDFITVKKKMKNAEYAVEMLVFKKEDIDELLEIQREIYKSGIEKIGFTEKMINLLKKMKGHK